MNQTFFVESHTQTVLDKLEETIRDQGFAGSTNLPKLIYLTFCTSVLDKPVSLVIKGPSGAGKSYSLNAAKQFVPEDAYQQFEGMSEKALVYLPLDLKHKHLILSEAAGMAEGTGRALLRQLLSEGEVRYGTVESTDKGLKGTELPTLKGPTGVMMTTTAAKLHPEDESRMLSVNMTESPEQIRAALLSQALKKRTEPKQIDTGLWFKTFEELRDSPKSVEIPFAEDLVHHLPTTHDRIKRDFPHLLSLIQTHALLHRSQRCVDDDGTVVADRVDYEAVFELTNDALSQGLAVTVEPSVRQVVEAVKELRSQARGNRVSMASVSDHIGRDIGVVSRNVKKATDAGFLVNENPGQGREADLKVGDRKLPSGTVLPSPDKLFNSDRPEERPKPW